LIELHVCPTVAAACDHNQVDLK